jgi:rhamnopyranosyl-N-acetylglucosaminyl-diphospho-decaprenol beta-1,3/1,4-galactofuranosyltransferase
MTPGSVAAVVVAYNRKVLLCECLDALLSQTKRLDAIFVVDNASTDGTGDLLRERGYLDHPSIRYLLLSSNSGGAGGFHAGMSAAQKDQYEWVWVMDDDTEPHLDALQKMERWQSQSEVVAIANRKVDRQGKETADGLRLMPEKAQGAVPYQVVRFSSFVGLLIRRTAMDAIGLPRREFFIHGDDTEYCFRLRAVGNIALAGDSLVAHKEVARSQQGRKLLSHTFYARTMDAFAFGFYAHRNRAWIERQYRRNALSLYLYLIARFAFFSATVLVFDQDHRWLRIKILAKANLDGIRGRFDNEYPRRVVQQLREQEAESARIK